MDCVVVGKRAIRPSMTPGVIEGERLMVGEPVSRDCGMAVSLGPKARLMPAWGIAPGSRPANFLASANGAVHRAERTFVVGWLL